MNATSPATVAVSIEATPKKTFASAIEWPGWSRSGKTEELALKALAAAAPRYQAVSERAAESLMADTYEVVERTEGGTGTEFGVPSTITDLDRRPVDGTEAERLARIVEAAWATFDAVAATAPQELRKGPRGGGRVGTRCSAT